MKTVLVDVPIHQQSLDRLQSIPDLRIETIEPREESRPLPAELIRDVHILFCMLPPANFDQMKRVELIQLCSAGYSQLFDLGLVEKGIRACNGRGNFDVPIAEWNVAMMVNLARNMPLLIQHQQQRIWDRSDIFQTEIRGSTVGIWGYGGIGRETARLAKAMGMTVHVLTRKGVRPRLDTFQVPGTGDPEGALPDREFVAGQELEFLSNLDFLILTLPLTRRSEGLIGERELRALRSTAFLLNPARALLIHESALLKALAENWIAGAALDVHYYSPMPPEHPLWGLPNVILTPHISGSSGSPHFVVRVWQIFLENVQRFLSGGPLLNELSAEQLRGE